MSHNLLITHALNCLTVSLGVDGNDVRTLIKEKKILAVNMDGKQGYCWL